MKISEFVDKVNHPIDKERFRKIIVDFQEWRMLPSVCERYNYFIAMTPDAVFEIYWKETMEILATLH